MSWNGWILSLVVLGVVLVVLTLAPGLPLWLNFLLVAALAWLLADVVVPAVEQRENAVLPWIYKVVVYAIVALVVAYVVPSSLPSPAVWLLGAAYVVNELVNTATREATAAVPRRG